eukprot:1366280-Prorocentrum_lima.AAC.1
MALELPTYRHQALQQGGVEAAARQSQQSAFRRRQQALHMLVLGSFCWEHKGRTAGGTTRLQDPLQ